MACYAIIDSAKKIGIDQVSFLPADVSSHAFNREVTWDGPRQSEVALSMEELPQLRCVLDEVFENYANDFTSGFIAESPAKLDRIFYYYSALHGLNDFPYKKCNAPWVSTVIEPDGAVKPCFFHGSIGNIRSHSLQEVINGRDALQFRKSLDMDKDETCRRCVCYLNLPPSVNPVIRT
jgi:Fe-coproporphyrin III synthase